ncbi:MAG: glycine cleavage system protein GcvH [Alphaproteobacteria bacterium]
MSNVPADLKYTDQHEWVKLEGEIATIGITDHAQEVLRDLVFVELPSVGRQVKAGEAFVVVESVKAASEVYAPVTGEVTARNEELVMHPELINTSPYDKGWICKIKLADTGELARLLDADKYKALLG